MKYSERHVPLLAFPLLAHQLVGRCPHRRPAVKNLGLVINARLAFAQVGRALSLRHVLVDEFVRVHGQHGKLFEHMLLLGRDGLSSVLPCRRLVRASAAVIMFAAVVVVDYPGRGRDAATAATAAAAAATATNRRRAGPAQQIGKNKEAT